MTTPLILLCKDCVMKVTFSDPLHDKFNGCVWLVNSWFLDGGFWFGWSSAMEPLA